MWGSAHNRRVIMHWIEVYVNAYACKFVCACLRVCVCVCVFCACVIVHVQYALVRTHVLARYTPPFTRMLIFLF